MVNIEITEKKENKLLGRVEVEGKLTFTGATPSNEVLKEKLAADLNKEKDLVVVKSIYSKYSHQEANFLVFIYDNKESMSKIEVSTKHLRKKEEEAKKKAAEAAKEESSKEEENKEETPAEEKAVEEVKEEEKLEEKSEEEKKEGEQ